MSSNREMCLSSLRDGVLFNLCGGDRIGAYADSLAQLSRSEFAADALLQCVNSGVNPSSELTEAVSDFVRAHTYGYGGPCVTAVRMQSNALVIRFALAASASRCVEWTVDQLMAFDILVRVEARRAGMDVELADVNLLVEGVMRHIGSTVTACTWATARVIFPSRLTVGQ